MAINQAVDWDDLKLRLSKMKSAIEAKPVFRWGIVTNEDPLKVQLDGAQEELEGSPSGVIGGYLAGDRVLVLIQNRRATLISRSGNSRSFTIGTYDVEEETYVQIRRNYKGLKRYVKLYPSASATIPEMGLQIGRLDSGGESVMEAAMYIRSDGSSRITTRAESPTPAASRPFPFAIASGRSRVTTRFPTISMPGGNRFTQAPRVVGQLITGAGGDIGNGVLVTNVTTTSFQARKYSGTGSTTMDWIAIQMTPTKASG